MIPEIQTTQFETEVLQSNRPVLVDFFTPGCSPCQQMLPIVTEIAAERSAVLKVLKFDASSDPAFVSRFRVSSVPNFVLFQDGAPIAQRSGFCSKRDLLAWIDSSLS